jgi:hypothetical protein
MLHGVSKEGVSTVYSLESRSEMTRNFGMKCWSRREKICWTDCVRNEEVLQRVKEERNILQTIKRMKANWSGHIALELPSETRY